MFARRIDSYLSAWKSNPDRKVLLLRGARQVGKTSSVRALMKSFTSSLEVNFLETPEVSNFFKGGSLAPEKIIEKLEVYYGRSLKAAESILFLDEIQECPEALTALRFFHEKCSQLHVIAAGSLLEFAISEIPSFGVGRIDSLFMYPLSFEEFLGAIDQQGLATAIAEATSDRPLDATLHRKACDLLKIYCLIGGLPEVVRNYADQRDVNACMVRLENILLSYEDDFAKYKTRIAPLKLRETLHAAAKQAGGKFVYSRINPHTSTSGYDQALELLRLAGVVYKVPRSSANGIPLGAEVDLKSFKTIPFDVGMYHRLLGMKIEESLLDDEVSFSNRGALAEVLCATELIAHTSPARRPELFYWAREQRGSNAEVDYVIQKGSTVLPIEVKSGTKGKMQSLYLFLNEKGKKLGIRSSMENFSKLLTPEKTATIEALPLYAVGRLVED